MNKICFGLLMIFIWACEDVINDPDEDLQRKGIRIDATALQNSWSLTDYFDEGESKGGNLSSYVVSFNQNQDLLVQTSTGITRGNWVLARDNQLLIIRINSNDEIIAALNDDWVVLNLTSEVLQIAEEDRDEDTRFTFERKGETLITREMLTDYWQLALYQENGNEISTEPLLLNLATDDHAEIIWQNGLTETGSWQLDAIANSLVLELGDYENSGKLLSANWQIEKLKGDTLKLENTGSSVHFIRYAGELPQVVDFLEHTWTVESLDPVPGDDADEFLKSTLDFENGIVSWDPYEDDDDDDGDDDDKKSGNYSIDGIQITISFDDDDDDDEGYWNGEYIIEKLTDDEFIIGNNIKSIVLKR